VPVRPDNVRVTTARETALAFAEVLLPGSGALGSAALGLDRLDPLLPALAADLAGSRLEAAAPRLLDAPGAAGDAARALLERAGSALYADERTWPSLGYRVLQPGVHWPADPAVTALRTTALADVGDSYDVVVVGSGAGGGTAAHVLTSRGLHVLLVERGPSVAPPELPLDHQRNARVSTGLPHQLDLPEHDNPRVVVGLDGRRRTVDSTDPEWSGNASAVGGGTLVYGAQAWRLCPEDLAMGSRYGPRFTDWPLGYADLEPYYERVEQLAGVSGPAVPRTWDGPRRRGYPMPPLPDTLATTVLRAGADELGLETAPPPLLISSRAFGGRPGCVRCGNCVGFACHANAKNGSAVSTIPLALATGRCTLLADTVAERVLDAGPTGAAVLLSGVRARSGGPLRRTVRARHVVLAAGAVETARLLLLSDLGNSRGQVGRHLQAHPYTGAVGVFDDVVQDGLGPGPSISATRYRHGNDPVAAGGILANEFVQTPVEAWHKLVETGLVPRWGRTGVEAMRALANRTVHLAGPLQQTPLPGSRVTLAATTDSRGLPVAALHATELPSHDRAAAEHLADRAAQWLTASGATTVRRTLPSRTAVWAGQHQAGTARMGHDPATSVTDPRGRVWGQESVSVADGSLHVTNGGVNPVLTIMALAWRVAEAVAADLT